MHTLYETQVQLSGADTIMAAKNSAVLNDKKEREKFCETVYNDDRNDRVRDLSMSASNKVPPQIDDINDLSESDVPLHRVIVKLLLKELERGERKAVQCFCFHYSECEEELLISHNCEKCFCRGSVVEECEKCSACEARMPCMKKLWSSVSASYASAGRLARLWLRAGTCSCATNNSNCPLRNQPIYTYMHA